jgi:hypothetical protein
VVYFKVEEGDLLPSQQTQPSQPGVVIDLVRRRSKGSKNMESR